MAEHRHGNASILADLSKHHQLFLEKFPLPDDKAKLYPMDWVQPYEGSDSKYDLHLNSRRLLDTSSREAGPIAAKESLK